MFLSPCFLFFVVVDLFGVVVVVVVVVFLFFVVVVVVVVVFCLFVCCCWFWFFLTGHFLFCFLLVVSLQSARHRCRSCCRCLRSHMLFVNSFLSVIQKPETGKSSQLMAKP